MRRLSCAAVVLLTAIALTRPHAHAATGAGAWFEITSPHFTVWAEANNGPTRTLLWQLEQIRHVAKNFWPWMKVDLPKPLVILAVRNEQSLKSLAPQYWEVKNGVRPASVWVTSANQNYIAIRNDIETRNDVFVNPHVSAYFSYANLVITTSFAEPMPLWVSRGLAGVLSNTLVRQNDVVVGAVIPWHLESLRARRVPLQQMLGVTRTSPEFRTSDGLRYFDAQAWAFVHYLMFGNDQVNAPKLNAFIAQIENGATPAAAFAAALGNVDDYERAFASYVNRSIYSAIQVKTDMGLDRERFPARQMTPPETSLAQAGFHVAMRRPADARTLLDAVQKAEPALAATSALEAIMLETEGNVEAARTAYAKAVELGTNDAYALYRYSALHWRGADPAGLERLEGHLAKAVEVRPLFAAAHAALAEIRAELKRPQSTIVPHTQKAITLEPSNPWHRLAAARVFARLDAVPQARQAAEAALKLADDDERARAEGERILARLK